MKKTLIPWQLKITSNRTCYIIERKEFLDKVSVVFDDKREDNLEEKLAEERREKAKYAQKVGHLTMQVDWLKRFFMWEV